MAARLLGGGVTLWHGDCLEGMPRLARASVHLVLCDLPYGVTECAWDKRIDGARLWAEYARVLRPRGAVVLFAQGRFAVELAASAPRGWYRYDWVWDKRAASGFLNAHRAPMRAHESLLVFGRRVRYFPQGLRRCVRRYHGKAASEVYRGCRKNGQVQTRTGYPTTVLRYGREKGAKPCQKPLALLEYLIRTYTRRGDVVLDNAMGLGSTGVAAVRTGRRFVGMEIDAARFAAARVRIEGERRA